MTTRARTILAACLFTAGCVGTSSSDETDAVERIENAIDRAFAEHVPDTDGRFVAGVLVVDVRTGDPIASAVSDGSERDLADEQRPSGSTLKLFLDVAAAELGVVADDGVIVRTGCSFPDGVTAPTDELTPILSIREATAVSSNCAFGKVARVIGPDRLGETVRRLGIDRSLDLGTKFGFGANTISMRELAGAAATLARSTSGEAASGLRPSTLGTVVEMTEEVLVSGTARGNALDGRWAIAKTGTSAQSTDAWIVGTTSEYAAVVWMGNPDQPDDGMVDGAVPGYQSVHGGDIPASIWHDVMEAAHDGLETGDPPPPLPDRDVVIVVDPSVDCLADPELVVVGAPVPEVSHITTGGPVRC